MSPAATKSQVFSSHPICWRVLSAVSNSNSLPSPAASTRIVFFRGSPAGLPDSQKVTRYFCPLLVGNVCFTPPTPLWGGRLSPPPPPPPGPLSPPLSPPPWRAPSPPRCSPSARGPPPPP